MHDFRFQVPLVQNPNKTGLGFSNADLIQCEVDPCTEKKQALWRKTQQRYSKLPDWKLVKKFNITLGFYTATVEGSNITLVWGERSKKYYF